MKVVLVMYPDGTYRAVEVEEGQTLTVLPNGDVTVESDEGVTVVSGESEITVEAEDSSAKS